MIYTVLAIVLKNTLFIFLSPVGSIKFCIISIWMFCNEFAYLHIIIKYIFLLQFNFLIKYHIKKWVYCVTTIINDNERKKIKPQDNFNSIFNYLTINYNKNAVSL